MEGLTDKLKEMKEWSKAAIFDAEGKLLAQKNCNPNKAEIE